MIRKTIEFATMGTRLSVAHHQLVVERPEMPKATLPIEDLGVVIVDDARATYTQAVFLELLAAGATVMVTGRDHLPAGMMLPLDAHHVQTERHRAQVEANLPTKKRIWQALIAAKIAQQGAVLDNFTGHHGGLLPLAKRVRSVIPTIWKRKPPSAIGPVYSARISAATEDPMGSMPLSTMVMRPCGPQSPAPSWPRD
jgi:CRISP-associated protein Cas1